MSLYSSVDIFLAISWAALAFSLGKVKVQFVYLFPCLPSFTVIGKAFLYLGTPPLCPLHQSCALTQLHFQYLGVCPICSLCSFSEIRIPASCSSPCSSCSGRSACSSARWRSSTKLRKWSSQWDGRSGTCGRRFEIWFAGMTTKQID